MVKLQLNEMVTLPFIGPFAKGKIVIPKQEFLNLTRAQLKQLLGSVQFEFTQMGWADPLRGCDD